MSLFGSKKKVFVDSVVYNLADESKEPIDCIRLSVIDGVISQEPYLGEKINKDLTSGMGMRFRHFTRWAKSSGYNDNVGLATSKYYPDVAIDRDLLISILKKPYDIDFNESFELISSVVTFYDYVKYADIWVINNRPNKINDPYSVEEFSVIVRTWTEWESRQDEEGHNYQVLVTKHEYRSDIRIIFSDKTVVEISTENVNKDVSFLYVHYTITKHHLIGDDEVKHYGLVYAHKSGRPELDDFFIPPDALEKTYSPYIPIRLWNKFVSTDNLPDTYKFAKKAFRKAVGTNDYDKIIKQISENDNLGDIDFAYVVFGVSLNTKQQEGKCYIFNLFKNFWENQRLADRISSPEEEKKYLWALLRRTNYEKSINIRSNYGSINYNVWLEWASLGHYYGTGLATLRVPRDSYSVDSKWSERLDDKFGTILYHKLKPGEYGIEAYNEYITVADGTDEEGNPDYKTETIEHTNLYYQISEGQYEVISITNLAHANYIYKGKAVITSGKDAMDDKEVSDFIVPMQENTFKEIGLRYATNLISNSYYLVFNCYIVKKIKWYQTGFFKFLTMVIVIIIAAVATYFGGPAGASLGAKLVAAVAGSAFAATFVGTMIAVAINMLVGMIIAKLVITVATKLFGEVIGTIIGTIATIMIMGGINSMANGGSFFDGATSFLDVSKLASAQNILKLTAAVGNAVSSYYNAATIEINKDMQKLMSNYETKLDEINQAFKELGGSDPMMLATINSALYSSLRESPESFINRTLMVGSDIVDLSIKTLLEYPQISISTELN